MLYRAMSFLSWVLVLVAIIVGFLELVEYLKEVSPWLGWGFGTIFTVTFAYVTKEIFLVYHMVRG
jgi:hypothetical protein